MRLFQKQNFYQHQMKLHSKITKDGKVPLTPMQQDWLKKHAGKNISIALDERSSIEMIKFFEGAVVPYFFYQSGMAFETFKDARNTLKLEFNPEKVLKLNGEWSVSAKSMSEVYQNKERFRLLLDKIQKYFAENEYEFPDSEDFKKWRDSAPLPEEIYPPLKLLIDNHASYIEASKKPWRR